MYCHLKSYSYTRIFPESLNIWKYRKLSFLCLFHSSFFHAVSTFGQSQSHYQRPLTITDLLQNKSVAYFQFVIIFLHFSLLYVTFQCGRKKSLDFFLIFFAHKKLKKPSQKVAYLWQLGVLFSLRLPKTDKKLNSVL